jgi:hypothetical protein
VSTAIAWVSRSCDRSRSHPGRATRRGEGPALETGSGVPPPALRPFGEPSGRDSDVLAPGPLAHSSLPRQRGRARSDSKRGYRSHGVGRRDVNVHEAGPRGDGPGASRLSGFGPAVPSGSRSGSTGGRGAATTPGSSNFRLIYGLFWEPTRRVELLTCCLQIRGRYVRWGPASSELPTNSRKIVRAVRRDPGACAGLATLLATGGSRWGFPTDVGE